MLHEINFKALGTDISVKIVSDKIQKEDFENLKKDLKNFYLEKEKIFSRFDENSELNFLNKDLRKFNPASKDIIHVAQKSLEFWKKSQGFFDPRIIEILENIGYKKDFKNNHPSLEGNIKIIGSLDKNLEDELKIKGNKIFFARRMDFSGIAKSYITDKLSELLKNNGYENFLVDSGGDIRICGKDESGEDWKVSIEGVPEEKLILELSEKYCGVATSGISRRKWEINGKKFHHLVNPKEPEKFNFNLKTVTVLEKSAQEADFWAKVLFLMGEEKGYKYSLENNFKAVFINCRGNVRISEEIKENINK